MQIPADDAEPDPLHARLAGFMVEMARAEMDLPHIVFSRDARGCMDSFSGPYPTALEALVAADIEQQIEREVDSGHALSFHIAALYPALSGELDGG
ncbi:hypothetical protein [Nostocoides sp. HKS02]|uniref:hypothetical protein n=1 Tax=Nostocoides sp. HKS02 TaxID=1813880 RepID=UPI0012B4512C|nr:hypothetical protein [Tetrasphaera sp. HKS02]QGN58968.1 hypothetical protein GKE56_14920 [Tetrasphaera sp. HKS02]